MSSPSKRRDMDVMKLMMSDHEVTLSQEDDISDLYVQFKGPEDSPYEGGSWKVHIVLPIQYPFRSPSVGFSNRIFHPNIDEVSGSVCLDVINQTWSPMYDLVNIFDIFLPQLLKYPNAADPLNSAAAQIYNRDRKSYDLKVRDHVKQYGMTHRFHDDSDSDLCSHSEEELTDSDMEVFSDLDDDSDFSGNSDDNSSCSSPDVMQQMADSMEL
eukprot:244450_1